MLRPNFVDWIRCQTVEWDNTGNMDQKQFNRNADPYKVMWAQSFEPDDSEIWMTFNTDTQYPEKGNTQFRVFFRRGKAVEIEELK